MPLETPPRTPWLDGFPPVVAHCRYRDLVEHPGYRMGKEGLSSEAALGLASDLITDAGFSAVEQMIGNVRPLIVGVHAEEMTGRNKIPLAYAELLADLLDLHVEPDIVQATVANHSWASSIYHRLVSQPTFDGRIEAGRHYLIVDDTCTAGGTLANLKGYIEANGGHVIGMSVIGLNQPDLRYDISFAFTTLARLGHQHHALDAFWQKEFGYGLECLTEGEAGHLLKAPDVGEIRNRLAAARRELDIE